jgi:hypothetical protein
MSWWHANTILSSYLFNNLLTFCHTAVAAFDGPVNSLSRSHSLSCTPFCLFGNRRSRKYSLSYFSYFSCSAPRYLLFIITHFCYAFPSHCDSSTISSPNPKRALFAAFSFSIRLLGDSLSNTTYLWSRIHLSFQFGSHSAFFSEPQFIGAAASINTNSWTLRHFFPFMILLWAFCIFNGMGSRWLSSFSFCLALLSLWHWGGLESLELRNFSHFPSSFLLGRCDSNGVRI